MDKSYIPIGIERYSTPEIEMFTTGVLAQVFAQEIGKKCVKFMLDYTDRYIAMAYEKPGLGLQKYLPTITKDNEKLIDIFERIKTASAPVFTIEELRGYGVSLCTIKTGLQRLWIERVQKKISSLKRPKNTGDYSRFRLLPGQHLFYYGAFTGRVTRSMSTATHHFVYLYDGLIMEVGTSLIEGCIDTHETAEQPDVPLMGRAAQYLYKGTMSYFGFSTIYESTKWARDYGQDKFYLYDYSNDASVKVMKNRLTRASSIIGKWSYSLLGSNNCENAANYISIGESLSTQACAIDTAAAVSSAVAGAASFTVPELRARIPVVDIPLRIPSFTVGIPKILDYSRTHEYNLRSMAEIPNCNTRNTVYSNRYISDDGYVCKGSLSRGLGIRTSTCNVDKRYCPPDSTCPDVDYVQDTEQHRVCLSKPGRRDGKPINRVKIIK